MPAPFKKRDNPEDRILKRAASELRLSFQRQGLVEPFPFYHCPNESAVPPQYRATLHAKGLERGVNDLVIVWPCADVLGQYPGASIELKVPGKDATREQLQWQQYYRAAGFFVCTAAGHRQTALVLEALGYIVREQTLGWLEWAVRADSRNL